MENKLTYFGLFESGYKFNELTENQQKSFLVKQKIYVKGSSDSEYDEDAVHPFYLDRRKDINFLGEDFTFENSDYTLNPEFIEEVYNYLMSSYTKTMSKLITNHINVLEASYQIIEDDVEKSKYIYELKKEIDKEFMKELTNPIFMAFHIQIKSGGEYKNLIKKQLRYDISHLSGYIFGLDNATSFLTFKGYYTHKRLTAKSKFCDQYKLIAPVEKEEIEFSKPSVPKSIAMLKASGFFELESIKRLNPTKLYQVIAIVIGKDPNNPSHDRNIRGNFNILNSNSGESFVNFTTNTHLKAMENLLK